RLALGPRTTGTTMTLLNSKHAAAPAVALSPLMKAALGLILQAHDTAVFLVRDVLEFAVEIQALKEVGLNHNDLRALICQGLVLHFWEQIRPGSDRRLFRPPCGLRLLPTSCFLLSDRGLQVARELYPLGPPQAPPVAHLAIGSQDTP